MDFFGSTLVAPLQIRFGNIDDVRTYVDHLCRANDVPEVGVRHRKGGTRAHFEISGGKPVIAIPTDHSWSMRESVVLHEISHHICVFRHGSTLHDAFFTGRMLALVEHNLGVEAELLLRTGYESAGVPV